MRGHWPIENSSHYVLDVTFSEDRSRMGVLRRLANGLLKNETSFKDSIKQKILKAGRSVDYLRKVLRIIPLKPHLNFGAMALVPALFALLFLFAP